MSASLVIGLIILFKMQILFAEIQILFDMKNLFLGLNFKYPFFGRVSIHYLHTHILFSCLLVLEDSG